MALPAGINATLSFPPASFSSAARDQTVAFTLSATSNASTWIYKATAPLGPIRKYPGTIRNRPCPCGSGVKAKRCTCQRVGSYQ